MLVAATLVVAIALTALSRGAVVAAVVVYVVQRLVRTPGRHGERPWWRQFERDFAGYVAGRDEQAGTDRC